MRLTKRGWYVLVLSIVTFSVVVNVLISGCNWYTGCQ